MWNAFYSRMNRGDGELCYYWFNGVEMLLLIFEGSEVK